MPELAQKAAEDQNRMSLMLGPYEFRYRRGGNVSKQSLSEPVRKVERSAAVVQERAAKLAFAAKGRPVALGKRTSNSN